MTARSNQMLLTAFTSAALLSAVTAQRELHSFPGLQHEGRAGHVIAPAGDVDGDGKDDLIVGQPLTDYGAAVIDRGSVIVYSGADGRWIANSVGSRSGMQLGASVCRLGDVDADGVTDFAAGAPFDDAAGGNAGYVRVFSGRSGTMIWDRVGEPASRFGFAVCAVGDLDHDGAPDLAVSAPNNSNSHPYGAVYFHSGRTGAQLTRVVGGSQEDFGYALASPGDLDGDGQPDLIVGSPGFDFLSINCGNVFAFGMRGTSRPQRLWMFYDDFIGNEAGGSAVAGLGDVDGDGRGDVMVAGVHGRVFVLSGATGAIFRRHFGAGADDFGAGLAGLGDVDGDDVRDYALGAPNASSGAGAVEVRSGRGGNVIASMSGAAGSRLGVSLAGLGDLDGDGLGEFAIGAPLWTRPDGRRVGRATVHGVDLRGGVNTFGTGCPATRPLTLAGSGDERPGGTLLFVVSNARPFRPIIVFLGISRTSWRGVALPFALGGLGEPGCNLYVSIDAILSTRPAGASGTTATSLRLPNDTALIGSTSYVQALEFLPGAPFTASNGASIYVGNR